METRERELLFDRWQALKAAARATHKGGPCGQVQCICGSVGGSAACGPPPPGSDEAQAAGCICPVIDNGHGRGYMGIPGVYVYRDGCLVHPAKQESRP